MGAWKHIDRQEPRSLKSKSHLHSPACSLAHFPFVSYCIHPRWWSDLHSVTTLEKRSIQSSWFSEDGKGYWIVHLLPLLDLQTVETETNCQTVVWGVPAPVSAEHNLRSSDVLVWDKEGATESPTHFPPGSQPVCNGTLASTSDL